MTTIIATPALITLLTDFGTQDVYVGVMKGAIAQINPALQVIDLTHQVPPQDVVTARFQLMNAVPYFPAGTVHVAVVDPGVGGQRRGIAVRVASGVLVGPDNGILSGVFDLVPPLAAVELTTAQYWRSPQPSATFHGRDIFAPVAAHLASGVPLEQVGQEIDPATLVRTALPSWDATETGRDGVIQAIDRFGNLITTIPGQGLEDLGWEVRLGERRLPAHRTYSAVPSGKGTALIGSHGWVEIAIYGGNAHTQWGTAVGTPVQVVFYPSGDEPCC